MADSTAAQECRICRHLTATVSLDCHWLRIAKHALEAWPPHTRLVVQMVMQSFGLCVPERPYGHRSNMCTRVMNAGPLTFLHSGVEDNLKRNFCVPFISPGADAWPDPFNDVPMPAPSQC